MTRRRFGTPSLVAILLFAVALAGTSWLEARMMLHMFVQIPLLVCSGILMAVGSGWGTRAEPAWGTPMVGGTFLFVTGVVTTWMIPRALDAAVESLTIDAVKVVSLFVAGAMGYRAWQQASAVVRTFVFGNTAWMTAVAGMLFLDAKDRLCTSYGAGEQKQAGIALIATTVIAVLLVFRLAKGATLDTTASTSH